MTAPTELNHQSWQNACGKVILFGEHAVVYGVKAIAGGIANAIRARAAAIKGPSKVSIPRWQQSLSLDQASENLITQTFNFIRQELGIQNQSFYLEIEPNIPYASGLGASAAVAVASIRALAQCFQIAVDNPRVNEIAFGCEVLAHGSPSGLDNTLATYGGLMTYQRHRDGRVEFEPIETQQSIPLIVAQSGKKGYTAATVQRVAEARQRNPAHYNELFDRIATISIEAEQCITANEIEALRPLMNANQECLRELGVSCDEIETVITTAQQAGAKGAKLTGSGDGGAVIILALSKSEEVYAGLQAAGISFLDVQLN